MGMITAEAICWQDGASETKPITDLVFAPISGESQQAILEPSEPSSKPPKSDIVSDIGNLIVVLVIVALVVFMIWLFWQI